MGLWHYTSRTWAAKGWVRWMVWAVRSRLAPVKRAAATLKRHLWGIINAVVVKVHKGHAESMIRLAGSDKFAAKRTYVTCNNTREYGIQRRAAQGCVLWCC